MNKSQTHFPLQFIVSIQELELSTCLMIAYLPTSFKSLATQKHSQRFVFLRSKKIPLLFLHHLLSHRLLPTLRYQNLLSKHTHTHFCIPSHQVVVNIIFIRNYFQSKNKNTREKWHVFVCTSTYRKIARIEYLNSLTDKR